MSSTRERVQATYDQLAVEYAGHLAGELAGKPLDRQLLERFADAVRGAGPVCDLGCGPGHVAQFLHDRKVDVRGVDISPRMVDEARRRSPAIEFEVGDLFALGTHDATFAGIVAFYSIVHIAPEALPLAFREMQRVLRPGAPLLLAFHVGEDVLRPDDLWGIPVSLDWIFFPTDVVLMALQVAGFTIDAVVEREPYADVEHASRRAYVNATRPLVP